LRVRDAAPVVRLRVPPREVAPSIASTSHSSRRGGAMKSVTGGQRSIDKVCFMASGSPEAQAALRTFVGRYGGVEPEDAGVVVALGGDGFMLETMHRFLTREVAIYGMNRGTVGFLMNPYMEDDLAERLATAHGTRLHPLRMRATGADGTTLDALAINEVSL